MLFSCLYFANTYLPHFEQPRLGFVYRNAMVFTRCTYQCRKARTCCSGSSSSCVQVEAQKSLSVWKPSGGCRRGIWRMSCWMNPGQALPTQSHTKSQMLFLNIISLPLITPNLDEDWPEAAHWWFLSFWSAVLGCTLQTKTWACAVAHFWQAAVNLAAYALAVGVDLPQAIAAKYK